MSRDLPGPMEPPQADQPPKTPTWVWILIGVVVLGGAVLLTMHLMGGGMMGHH
jgi:hypothetical protein